MDDVKLMASKTLYEMNTRTGTLASELHLAIHVLYILL